MPPKKVVQAAMKKQPAKKAGKAAAATTEEVKQLKLELANFKTQLNNSKEGDAHYDSKKKVLALYESLPFRSEKKKELLAQWQKDKSCSWINMFCETRSTEVQSTRDNVLHGFGTKLIAFD